jgi:hypothetical protein
MKKYSKLRTLFLVTLLGLSPVLPVMAQKSKTYTASNGMIYSVGDTVILGVGSAPDGYFVNIYSGMARTIFATLAEEAEYDFRLPDFFHGAPVEIRRIRNVDDGTLLLFDTDGWGGFVIDIEKAIAACEVSYCRPFGFLTQEEFEKLILLNRAAANGEISVERFEELRKELLE